MSQPRALIAEDEPRLREQLAERLAKLWPELELAAQVGDGMEAVQALDRYHPNILFLDIQMPGLNGLEVARYASNRCHVAFITAYDEYAVAAFEQGAVDYVLKPFTAARLATTVGRLKERLVSPPADLSELLARLSGIATQGNYLRWINASVGKVVKLITVDEVCYFQADNKYTLVVTPHTESLIYKTIKELSGGARSTGLLADSPLHSRQRQCYRQCGAQRARPRVSKAQRPQRVIAGGRRVCSSVP